MEAGGEGLFRRQLHGQCGVKTLLMRRKTGYVHRMEKNQGASVLDRLLDPISRCLTAESAKALVELRADPVVTERIAELAEKCNQGALSAAERQEYETYVHAGNRVAILQAKARLLLNSSAGAACL